MREPVALFGGLAAVVGYLLSSYMPAAGEETAVAAVFGIILLARSRVWPSASVEEALAAARRAVRHARQPGGSPAGMK